MTSSPGPMFSAIRQASKASLLEETPDGVCTTAILRYRSFTLCHLRTEDELLRRHHLGDGLVNLFFNRKVLRFQVEQRNVHRQSMNCTRSLKAQVVVFATERARACYEFKMACAFSTLAPS